MFYKDHEIIGIANIASYSTLEDNGNPDAYITEFGEHGQINQYTFIQGSPFDVEEDTLLKYNSIEECKKAIDELGKDNH